MKRPNKEVNELQKRNKIYLDELRANATKAELKFKEILDKINVKYIFQKGFFGDRYHCIVDFYLQDLINFVLRLMVAIIKILSN